MNVNRVYRRCHVTGKGELGTASGKHKFEIHDISASGASILLDAELDMSQTYDLHITFIGNHFDITMHPKVKITRFSKTTHKYIYGITFLDLTEMEKIQIDEIVNHQCAVDDMTLGENCDEHGCVFIKKRMHH